MLGVGLNNVDVKVLTELNTDTGILFIIILSQVVCTLVWHIVLPVVSYHT